MKTGMLWLDADTKRPFAEKIRLAADYYHNKYGQFPTMCLVHKTAIDQELTIDDILVQPAKSILPAHFWLGIESP